MKIRNCKISTILPSFWPHFVIWAKIDYWIEVRQRGLTYWHQKNFQITLTLFSRLGFTRARARRARRARLQDIFLAWSKSEGNFDFEPSDSWPQNYKKVGNRHLESLSFLFVDLLRIICKNSIFMTEQNHQICPQFSLYLINARSYWLDLAFI